ncbi:MAG TPA: hypothetical protein VGO63_03060 [Candidatus Paceibacterota bacterium]|jgi:hypothetical protein|nr:hypothetical protein [Candidatus Paceibacterota bacterium]
MTKRKFKPSHLFLGIADLLAIEALFSQFLPVVAANETFILIFAILGAGVNIYVSIEAIEEVKGHLEMLGFLSLIVLEFIVFFSFQYYFLLLVQPASFPALTADIPSILLHSTMVFVFNPIYLPETLAGEGLLLIHTLSALGLVLFILQNIWQLRAKIAE